MIFSMFLTFGEMMVVACRQVSIGVNDYADDDKSCCHMGMFHINQLDDEKLNLTRD